jgi:Kef-type K+ transport system membrane component KefB
MKNIRSLFFYIVIIGGFSAIMYWIVLRGAQLEVGQNIVAPDDSKSHWSEFINAAIHNFEGPLSILLLQIVAILIVARLFGWICTKIGQPTVVGEVIAGIVLGPSLIGMYFPAFSAILFPVKSFDNLKILSQIGLIIFMYVVGMELDLKTLKNQARDAIVISHASIIVPFALGMGLAFFIYNEFAPQGVLFSSFSLFTGIAMSITAFPVLARIVQERGIQKTKVGVVVITCAAADDITAWCILATVIAIVKAGSFLSSLYVIFLALAYVLVMLKIVRPFLQRVGDLHTSRENLSKPIVAIFFLTLILSSYLSELIGIHALFGAFMAGAIMPDNVKFRNLFIEKVEDLALVLLLPLFFVFTGLRTQIGLLNDPYHWEIAGLIIVVAVTGKFFGSAFAAKFVGQNWKDSLTIGALMNTRGLMELVVLNIGYDLGVLTPEVFAMMVIMALVTTFMTSPALDLINKIFKTKPEEDFQEIRGLGKYRILLSFANPESGRTLLRLANSLIRKLHDNAALTAMHLSPVNELNHYNEEEYEKESFGPVIEESLHLNQKFTTLFKASNDIDTDIINVANKGDYDLLLIGLGQSIFEGSLLGKVLGFTTQIINPEKILNSVTGRERLFDNSPFDERTQLILARSEAAVGIFIDKKLTNINRVFIPVFMASDTGLIRYAQKLIHNNEAQVIVIDAVGEIKNNAGLKESIRAIEQTAPNHITLQSEKNIDKNFLMQQDLMIVSHESWRQLVETKSPWLQDIPSTLIIADKTQSWP